MSSIFRIARILDGCLTWQERHALPACDDRALTRNLRKLASSTASAAAHKKTFLHDVLECSLNDPTCGELRSRPAASRSLHDVVTTADGLRRATAFAKVFRVAMSTGRLSWNPDGRFHYHPLHDRDRILYPAQYAFSHGPKLPDALRPAAKLARGLKRLAVAVAGAAGALGGAAAGGTSLHWDVSWDDTPTPEDAQKLYAAAARVYPALGDSLAVIIDRIWRRDTRCVYSRDCLGYDEYYYLCVCPRQYNASAATIRTTATVKMKALKSAEMATKPTVQVQWASVARHWLCRGFRKCLYTWDEGATIRKYDKTMRPRDEVREVVDYIDNEQAPIYTRIRQQKCFAAMLDDVPAAVRMATAGYDVGDISKALPTWPRGRLYSLFFVAATSKRGLKLQECWDSIAVGEDTRRHHDT